MNADSAVLDILMVFRVVYEDGHFLGSNLPRSVAKDKQHGVNDVRLATAVWAHYGAETLYSVHHVLNVWAFIHKPQYRLGQLNHNSIIQWAAGHISCQASLTNEAISTFS